MRLASLALAAALAGCAPPGDPEWGADARRGRIFDRWSRRYSSYRPWRGWDGWRLAGCAGWRPLWGKGKDLSLLTDRHMDAKTGLPRFFQAPDFRRVVEAYGLRDKPLADWERVFGEPDAPPPFPDSILVYAARRTVGAYSRTGGRPDYGRFRKLYSWGGSIAAVPYAPGERRAAEGEVIDSVRRGGAVVSLGTEDGVSRGDILYVCATRGGTEYVAAAVVVRTAMAKTSVTSGFLMTPVLVTYRSMRPTEPPRGARVTTVLKAGAVGPGASRRKQAPPGPVEPEVLGIDRTGVLVMLSVGTDLGVRKGDRLKVRLHDGSTVEVEVERTFRDMCSARILGRKPRRALPIEDEPPPGGIY